MLYFIQWCFQWST